MVTVGAPATTANLGPGFDCLGMALNLHNYICMELRPHGLEIFVEGEGAAAIPLDNSNIVCQAAFEIFKKVGFTPSGLEIRLKNNIPVARGLGSSAAAVVGGLVAANQITGCKVSRRELLQLATSFEGHPDNVAPALFGGTVITGNGTEVIYHRILTPTTLTTVVAVPDFPLSTKMARTLLPTQVRLEDAVYNISRMGLLVAAFTTGQLELLTHGVDDRLHQPYRRKLIPGMEAVFDAAKQAGALAVALSGAGPTLIAFAKKNPGPIAEAMTSEFAKHGVTCRAFEIEPQLTGTEILQDGGLG